MVEFSGTLFRLELSAFWLTWQNSWASILDRLQMSLHTTLWSQHENAVRLAWADAGHTLVVKQWFRAGWAGSSLWHCLVSVIVWLHFTQFSHLSLYAAAPLLLWQTLHGNSSIVQAYSAHKICFSSMVSKPRMAHDTGLFLWPLEWRYDIRANSANEICQIPALNWFWCNLVCCILYILFVISYFSRDWFNLWALF